MTTWGVKQSVGKGQPASADGELADAQLVSRCQNGQVSAFEQLMDRYQDRVFNLVYRLTGHYQDAQDVTQDVFLRAFEHIGQFRHKAQFYTWLFRIAVNRAISRRRRIQRLRFVALESPVGDGDDAERIGDRLADPRGEPPAAMAQRGEQAEAVSLAVASLDDEFRAVLVLKDIEGFDYQQIAEILELPIGTIKSRLHRARLELKRMLGRSDCDG